MELSHAIDAISKLEERVCKATQNAEQRCVGVTFELFSDGSCTINFHWCSRSLREEATAEDQLIANLLSDLKGDNETVHTFDNLEDFQRYLLDENLIS